jgi:anti-sigma B factor antagonist
VSELLAKGHNKILYDLGDVHYIDTSGLGFLLTSLTSVRKRGGDLKLLKLPKKVLEVMQVTKLYIVFDIFDDEAAAIGSFDQSAAANA